MTFVPLVGALAIVLMPKNAERQIKALGMLASGLTFVLALVAWRLFEPNSAELQLVERYPWIPTINVDYYLGVDGLSITMVLLTALITPLSLIASWNIRENVRTFWSLFLLLETGMIGVFTALNFFHWFIFWEISLVPMFFLIKLWGAENRTYASFKFFIYTLVGSVTMLLAFQFLYLVSHTFNFDDLATKARSGELAAATIDFVARLNEKTGLNINVATFSSLLFWGVFLGFAIKVPMWPFHTWLPDAHTQAPTGGSMVLAAILLKMGVYGFLRVVLPIFPNEVVRHLDVLLLLALASIIFGAFAAMAQNDFKRLVAYSSINHMGYCMLGIFVALASAPNVADAFNEKAAALNGAVLQMFNHGISSAALFFLVGVVYDRAHTRMLSDFGGLRKIMPIYTGVLGISMFSSLGLPGLNGFVGEFLVFKGSFPLVPTVTALATIGLVVTAIFLLNMVQKVCFGPLNDKWRALPDMTAREIFVGAALMLFMFWIGVWPQPFLNASNAAVMRLIQLLGG
jgi:NADH-quinone oxidoreductase subunit M